MHRKNKFYLDSVYKVQGGIQRVYLLQKSSKHNHFLVSEYVVPMS